MRGLRLALAGVLLCAAPAAAQSYVVSTATAPYPPLTNPTVVALSGDADLGYAQVPIGFNFTFYGKTYTHLTVSTEGLAYLEPFPGTSSYPTNVALPSGGAPNAVLAPLWDNLEGSNPFSRIGYQLGQTPSGKVLSVEWKDWNHWSATATYDLDFQLRLHESGLVEFHYATFTGGGAPLSATVGIEDGAGLQGVSALACNPGCAHTELAPNTLITFGPGPNTLDLIAGRLSIDQITESGGVLTLDTRLEVQNFGTVAAELDAQTQVDRRARYALYLSADTAWDASDVPLSPAEQGPLAVPPMTRVTHAAQSTVPLPATGTWYLLAKLDPTDLLAETSETNNGAASAPLVSGTDLVAQAVSADVSSSGPGEPVVNTLEFSNVGLSAAGTVAWRLLLSQDTAVDPGDLVVRTGSLVVSGGQNVRLQVPYDLPANVPSGDYWFALQLDPLDAVAELSETNNVVFSTSQFSSRQADLVVGTPRLFAGRPPHPPASSLYFGEPFRLEVDVTNVGGATATDFSLVAFLSQNDLFNAASDPEAGERSGLTLAPGATATLVLTGSAPPQDVTGQPLAPGPYFLFAAAFSNGNFVEVSQANNLRRLGPIAALAPGPDLVATSLLAPAQVGPGERVPVSRVLKNVGNRAAPAAKYRYFLSRNELLTEQDLPLRRVLPDGSTADDGTVTLGLDGSDQATEWVELPLGLVPGEYRLGVYVDPRGTTAFGEVREEDESNNGFAGAPVEVVEPRFSLATTDLPAALVGVPYLYRLSARGAVAPVLHQPLDPAELPEGISLREDGTLLGTAAGAGIWPFTVRTTDVAGGLTETRLVLRAIPAQQGAVTVTATRLPAPVRNAAYQAWLSAQGGVAPYRWRLEEGALPSGVALEESGRLSGLVTAEAGATFDFTARVVDAAGSLGRARFRGEVVAPGSLYIQAPAFPLAQVGADFAADLVARPGGSQALELPLQWELSNGALPPGTALAPQGEVALVRGVPTRAGQYAFTVQVTDARGRVDTADLLLTVAPLAGRLVSSAPRVVLRGMEVEGAVRFEGGEGGLFSLHSGQLPPGVTLKPDGVFAGLVPEDAPFRTWTFTVRGQAEGGATGLLPTSIEVAEQLPPVAEGCGCGASGPGGWLPLLLLGLWPLARRRSG